MCPVCRARFRGSTECSRCGADLTIVMALQLKAWRLREAAREALSNGDFIRAKSFADQAEEMHSTPAGKHIQFLSSWMAGNLVTESVGPGEETSSRIE